MIRVYFWYEPIEVELINKERDPKIDISLIRHNMNKLLLSLPFTKKDFILLCSHCSTCADHKQVLDFLSEKTRKYKASVRYEINWKKDWRSIRAY